MDLDLTSAESQLNTLIERRGNGRDKANAEEMLWQTSERRYRERQQRRLRAEWYRFFMDQADSHAQLSESYQRRAEALLEEVEGGGGT